MDRVRVGSPRERNPELDGVDNTREAVDRAGISDATESKPGQCQKQVGREFPGKGFQTKITGLFLSRAHTLDGLELKVGFPWRQVLHRMDAPVWNPCGCARFADEAVVDVDEHWVVVVLDALDKGGEETCRLSDCATGHATGLRTCLPRAGV